MQQHYVYVYNLGVSRPVSVQLSYPGPLNYIIFYYASRMHSE